MWIATGYSSYEETEIADYQAANDPSRPLNSLSESEVDFELDSTQVAKALDRILEPSEVQPGETTVKSKSSEPPETASVVTGKREKDEVQGDDEGAREKIRRALCGRKMGLAKHRCADG